MVEHRCDAFTAIFPFGITEYIYKSCYFFRPRSSDDFLEFNKMTNIMSLDHEQFYVDYLSEFAIRWANEKITTYFERYVEIKENQLPWIPLLRYR